MPEKNILIADDEDLIRKMLIRLLNDEGHRFFEASNGKEAVEVVQNQPIDLAIIDIVMPEMNGIKALKRIKEIDNTIEVLMITGKIQVELLREIIFEHGAFDYILKPFIIDELKLTIQKALHNRKLILKGGFLKKELENRVFELERDFKKRTYELRRSQIKYRGLIENSTDAIVVTQDGHIKFANSVASKLTGYSTKEMLSIPFVEILYPDDIAETVERYNKRLKGEDISSISTFRVMRKDGSFFWVENNAVRTLWGEKPAVLNMVRDLSERIDLQDALGVQTHKLNERVKEITCLFRISELAQNPGLSEKEINQEIANLIPQAMQYPEIACARIISDDQEFKTDNFRETPWKLIYPINIDDRHPGTLEVRYLEKKPNFDKGPFLNEERMMFKVIAERIERIARRIRTEKNVKIKDQALGASISGIGLADLQGNITYVNPAFLKMWGYSDEEEVVGESLQRFTYEEGKSTEMIERLFSTGFYVDQITAIRKDGSLFDAQISANMVTDKSNGPIYMMGSFLDITQQKMAERLMMRAEKLSSLGQLSAGLAHELRNPLAVVSSCSQFCLENMKLERLVRKNFQVIYRNSQRASKLISELLVFARPDQLEYNEVDINELLIDVLQMTKLEVDPSHVSLVRYLKKGLPKIMGDKEKLSQVFLNLIQNAIQAVSSGGKISLKSQFMAADDMLEVRVSDNGPGIPEEYREKVFDPFFTTKDGGTGLGLSICNSIVAQHRGILKIENDEEGRTQVLVRLPVKQETTKGV